MFKTEPAAQALAGALTELAKLYQFRSLEARSYAGLTVSQNYTMRDLFFNGPRRMSELAGQLGVPLSTMTGVIDQLEGKGLVERQDHPEDRRSLQVRLTADGRKLYQSANDAFLSHLAPLVENRPAAECDRLVAFLGEVAEAVRGWRKGHRRKDRG